MHIWCVAATDAADCFLWLACATMEYSITMCHVARMGMCEPCTGVSFQPACADFCAQMVGSVRV